MKRKLALFLFDFGSRLVQWGLKAQGATKATLEFHEWSDRVERRALSDSFRTTVRATCLCCDGRGYVIGDKNVIRWCKACHSTGIREGSVP